MKQVGARHDIIREWRSLPKESQESGSKTSGIERNTSSFHNIRSAQITCRRQIEKSPLAQIEMSLSTVLVGEFWADDGDYDEPDGDRPDERVAGSGGEQDQSNGRRDADETWSASGVPTGQGLRSAGPGGLGFPEARSGRAIAAILRIYAMRPLASSG